MDHIPVPDKIIPRRKADSSNMKGLFAEYIADLFEVRNMTHKLHLITDSYAEHKALDQFYKEIIPLADAIAETAFGTYGKPISVFETKSKIPADPIGALNYVRGETVEIREQCSQTHLQNELDNVLTLIDTTKYLLTLK